MSEDIKPVAYAAALPLSVDYFNGDDLAAKVFLDKYALRDNEQNLLESTPDGMHRRIAKELARIEKGKFQKPLNADTIYSYLKGFKKIIPQGSPMYGIGNKYQYISLSNCFTEGTRVLTSNGVKNIEDVSIGDSVVTHGGCFRGVEQIHKNNLDARQIYRLKCFRTPEVYATGNHKFLSISQEQMLWGEKAQWNPIEYLRSGDYVAVPDHENDKEPMDIDIGNMFGNKFEDSNGNEYLIEVGENNVTWNLQYSHSKGGVATKRSRSINRKWALNDDFAYFLGLWYGDGCVFSDRKASGQRQRKYTKPSKTRGITFTFGAHEKEIIAFITSYGRTLFGIDPDVNDNSLIDGSVQIIFASALVGSVFSKLFGRGAYGKSLWTNIFEWPRKLVERLTQGLVDSDGCITKGGELRVVMANQQLVESFYHLLRSFGEVVGLTTSVKVSLSKNYYARLDFGKDSNFTTNSLKFYDDNRKEHTSSSPFVVEIDGRKFVRIMEKQKSEQKPEFVYTLGINEFHSYPVEGLVSLNCYVVEPPLDSYGSICKTDQHLVQISKRRGGNGTDISMLRPAGTATHNAARTSTGISSFMERFSNSIREVGQSGRRGALMLTISVHHPEVEMFATIKNDRTKVTGANISIRLTDEFLNAVLNDKEYEQRWPCTQEEADMLKVPFPRVSKMVRARDVWKTIIHNAWSMAEPGLLFWDNIIRESVADCYAQLGFKTVSTNPCSEIPLSVLDSCRLLLLNCLSYVTNPFTKDAVFEYDNFYEDVQVAQRLMDDIVDLEIECIDRILGKIKNDPESEEIKRTEIDLWEGVKEACLKGRRTGTGITALGDTLAALGIKYSSDDSIEVTERIYKTLKFGAYRASVDMAKEIGPFPVWMHELENECPFLKRIESEMLDTGKRIIDGKILYDNMKDHGRRNIALLTTAPAGSVSMLTQTTSGIEPLFMMGYTRRKRVNPNDGDLRVDFVDQNGDKWQEFMVYHPTVKMWMDITGETDITKSPWYGCCAEDIDWKQRVILQAKANLHVDHAISSCIVKDSLIETEDGLMYLDELCDFSKIPEKKFRLNDKDNKVLNHNGKIVKLDEFYNNGPAIVGKVNLINGMSITCTYNEKLLVLNDETGIDEWKDVQKIKVGDRIKVKNNRS